MVKKAARVPLLWGSWKFLTIPSSLLPRIREKLRAKFGDQADLGLFLHLSIHRGIHLFNKCFLHTLCLMLPLWLGDLGQLSLSVKWAQQ